MRKIKYPFDDSNEKQAFIKDYYNLIRSNFDETNLETLLKNVDPNYSFKLLLTSDFSDLLDISKKIKVSNYEKNIKDFFTEIKNNKIKYKYDDYQLKISSFLMDKKMKLCTCYYCNIDFINTVEQHYQFSSIKDFILNAPYEVLMLENKITKSVAQNIIKFRNRNFLINWTKLINESIYNSLFKKFNKKNVIGIKNVNLENIVIKRNHFTLDHILPKSEFPFLSLSIFNFVPSCSSCNSKFKHQKQFTVNEDLLKVCPSSDQFELDEFLSFKMQFDINNSDFEVKINSIKEIKDVEIKLENKSSLSVVDEFIEIFKLKSRYEFHKGISYEMIEKRQLYSDSQIKEISDFFKNKGIFKSEDSIKKDIFGKELFEETNAPFEKYKRDIAKQLGLVDKNNP